MTELTQKRHIGKVVLTVKDLVQMTQFYQKIIGMEVITQNSEAVVLGAKNNSQGLIVLQQATSDHLGRQTHGLFHLALLLPTREALGTMLQHLIDTTYPLTGASDHGYSEAIYLNDPEGNGIEIYWDKPTSEWDIQPDGQIIGVTEQMDIAGVLKIAQSHFNGLPSTSYLGHVHLAVADLKETAHFYHDVLNLDITLNLGGQALFFATEGYHHHIAANTWLGTDTAEFPLSGALGLAYYTLLVTQQERLSEMRQRLDEQNYPYKWDEMTSTLTVTDPTGILMKIELAQID
ncbi:hypothetical protein CBF34_08315 [Vagococcus penaei]|uniref:Uncharacterized protein n=1 Tax=Vagococcus penaei TaxID=633807 RepID=A0A1Q2D6B5_9ENTE|nr:VOC family protein [Vagococcus penaei]AQP53785.1 hypothetical protein BW732_05715 [Vagococcus penaei]RSU00383.1 hypothetical protein CBF34_08315 [Vagococcus penaei]